MMLLAVSCNKEEIILPMENKLFDAVLKKAHARLDLCLEGNIKLSDVYAPKEKKPIIKGDEMFLLMFATLKYDVAEEI